MAISAKIWQGQRAQVRTSCLRYIQNGVSSYEQHEVWYGDVKEVSEASYKSRLCLYGNSFKSDTSKQVHRKLLMYSGVYDVYLYP